MNNEENVQGIKSQQTNTDNKTELLNCSRVPLAVIPTPPKAPTTPPRNQDK